MSIVSEACEDKCGTQIAHVRRGDLHMFAPTIAAGVPGVASEVYKSVRRRYHPACSCSSYRWHEQHGSGYLQMCDAPSSLYS